MRVLMLGDTHGHLPALEGAFVYADHHDCEEIWQLGDFGYGWAYVNRKEFFTTEAASLVERSGIPLKWLGGNHENYDALYSRVDEDSTEAFELEPGVTYWGRGHAFEVDDVRFLTCGGAASVDKNYRKPHVSWWPQEEITEEQVQRCIDQGSKHDVLLTHDFPWECEIVDRHLDDTWGHEATLDTERGRKTISTILRHSGANRQFHGHLHRWYSEIIQVPELVTRNFRKVYVTGLGNPDSMPINQSAVIFDTELFKETGNGRVAV